MLENCYDLWSRATCISTMAKCLLSSEVPPLISLTKRNVAALFMTGKALSIDQGDNMQILGHDFQNADGLSYKDGQQKRPPMALTWTEKESVANVKAVARVHFAATKTKIKTTYLPLSIVKVSGPLKTTPQAVQSAMTPAK